MRYKVTQIRSANSRPSDHKDFQGDEKLEEIFSEEAWDKFKKDWLDLYLAQGDQVLIERILDNSYLAKETDKHE